MSSNLHPTFGDILAAFKGNIERKHQPRLRCVEGCAYCERNKGDSMMPSHDASSRCESGKHNHCACDTCF